MNAERQFIAFTGYETVKGFDGNACVIWGEIEVDIEPGNPHLPKDLIENVILRNHPITRFNVEGGKTGFEVVSDARQHYFGCKECQGVGKDISLIKGY